MHNQPMDKYAARRQALQRLIDEKYHGVVAAFARAADIDASYVGRMLYPDDKPGRKRIGEDIADKITKLHPTWIYPESKSDVNRTFSTSESTANYGNIGEKIPLWGRVPIISWVAAGNWSVSVDNFQPGEADEWVATTLKVKQHTFALRVQGQSMEPRFPEGGVIIVEPDEEARNGSFVIVRQNGDETTFKQLEIDGGRYLLVPLNPKFQAMEMKPDAVICGVVKQLVLDV